MDKLNAMMMFVRVVEAGSFTAAAEVSGVSATMVAKHIRVSEERLGARLLHRTTRRQHLTEVGQLYYERCKKVLAQVELADASASELQETPCGKVRLIAPVSFGSQLLVPALACYLAQNPEVEVDLTLDNRTPDFNTNDFELAILIGELKDTGLVARALRSYRRILAASPDYLKVHGLPSHPEELKRHSCLGIAYWQRPDQWPLVSRNDESCVVSVKGRFSSNHGNALRMAAISGAGIVLQPEDLLESDIVHGRLQRVLADWSYKQTPMHLIYRQDTSPTAKLRSVIDFILNEFPPEP